MNAPINFPASDHSIPDDRYEIVSGQYDSPTQVHIVTRDEELIGAVAWLPVAADRAV